MREVDMKCGPIIFVLNKYKLTPRSRSEVVDFAMLTRDSRGDVRSFKVYTEQRAATLEQLSSYGYYIVLDKEIDLNVLVKYGITTEKYNELKGLIKKVDAQRVERRLVYIEKAIRRLQKEEVWLSEITKGAM